MAGGSPQASARALALRLLARSARTEAQLRRRLGEAGLEGEAEEVLGWLRGLGYLDDAGWARARALSLLAPGRLGPRGAERRIASAGIPPGLARRAVEDALRERSGVPGRDEGELRLCLALAERRARAPLEALDERARARLARFLLGRGFAAEAVARVLRSPPGGAG